MKSFHTSKRHRIWITVFSHHKKHLIFHWIGFSLLKALYKFFSRRRNERRSSFHDVKLPVDSCDTKKVWPSFGTEQKVKKSRTSIMAASHLIVIHFFSSLSLSLSPLCVCCWSAFLLPCGSSRTADSPVLLPPSPFIFLHYSNKCVAFFLRHKATQEPWPQRAHSTHELTHLHTKLCITLNVEQNWIEKVTQFKINWIKIIYDQRDRKLASRHTLMAHCCLSVHLLLCLCYVVCVYLSQQTRTTQNKGYTTSESSGGLFCL